MDTRDAADSGAKSGAPHVPVMVEEIRRAFELAPGSIVVDATVGAGGHALALIEEIGKNGVYIGIDRDPEILEIAKDCLKNFGNFHVCHGDFRNLRQIMEDAGVVAADAVLFDLGVSSYQLSEPGRGFSFMEDGPLDMRFDISEAAPTAADVLARIPENELSGVLRKYGDERGARRIAKAICARRDSGPIRTTSELADIVSRAVGRRGRIHPATRTFQALRMFVNSELDALANAVGQIAGVVLPGGRVAVISFHSGEDRIVKNAFRDAANAGFLELITPKPVTPGDDEVARNPRARSAKLRIAKRTFAPFRREEGAK